MMTTQGNEVKKEHPHVRKIKRMYYFEPNYIRLLYQIAYGSNDDMLNAQVKRNPSVSKELLNARLLEFQGILEKIIYKDDCGSYHVRLWLPLNKSSVLFLIRTMGEFKSAWTVFNNFWYGGVYMDLNRIKDGLRELTALQYRVKQFHFFHERKFDPRSMLKGKTLRSIERARKIMTAMFVSDVKYSKTRKYLITSGISKYLKLMQLLGLYFQIS